MKPPAPQDPFALPPRKNADGSWTFTARISSITDGDTCWVWIVTDKGFGRMGSDPENIRLARINAPEKTGATKAAGLASMAWAQKNFPPSEPVYLTTMYAPTFSRYVGEIARAHDMLNWSTGIVEAGHAVYQKY